MSQHLKCLKCGKINKNKSIVCLSCGGAYSLLKVEYKYQKPILNLKHLYSYYLPFKLFKQTDFKNCSCNQFSKNIWIKNEGENESKSIKEKELIVGLKTAMYLKFKKAICVTSGSGIYAAFHLAKKFNQVLDIYSPNSKKKKYKNQILLGKDYEDTFRKVLKKLNSDSFNITPGINPYSQEGAKVISWQLISSKLDFDKVIIPCGNGSAIWGIYKGFAEAEKNNLIKKIPQLYGVELKNGPIGKSIKTGRKEKNKSVLDSKASAINAKESFCLEKAIIALKKTNGKMISVNEKEIEKAYYKLHRFNYNSCYSAAASLAGVIKLNSEPKKSKICCILTASE